MKENPPVKEKSLLNSTEERFKREVGLRFDLWMDLVDDSAVSAETKNEIKQYLSRFRDDALIRWDDLAHACSNTLAAIQAVTDKDIHESNARALFRNLHNELLAIKKKLVH